MNKIHKKCKDRLGKFIKDTTSYKNLEFSKCIKEMKTTVYVTDAFAKS